MKRKYAAIAAVALAALLMSGCASVSSDEDLPNLSSAAALNALCGEEAEAVLARVAPSAEAKPNSGKRNQLASMGFSNPKDEEAVAALVTTLEERAATECPTEEELAQAAADLAQCRTDAAFAYMREEGFTDNEFVVGEERIDWENEVLNSQGAAGFRGDEKVATSREELQESFDSDNPDLVLAANAHLAQLPDLDRAVVLNAENWEAIQITVDAEVAGNTGLNGDVQVAVGNTPTKAGDAQWFFVDSATCKVTRANFDAAGNPVDPNTPEADKPVVAHRPGCANPTAGFHKPPPPPPVNPPPVTPPGTNPKNINEAPQRTGALPTQQMPNPLPAQPEHFQPSEPVNPPATYTPPPAAPAPAPAPVGPIPAPAPEPSPIVVTPPVEPAPAPSDPGTSTSCAPGQTTC